MRNGWNCWVSDRRRPVLAALALLVALSSAAAIWGPRRPGSLAELYRARCSSCHDLPDLSRYRKGEIAGIVGTMREHRGAGKVISDREAGEISRYLEEQAAR